jgi:endonuclease/exonuclease/phosphatase family metal-dependent hydrolase
MLKLMTLNINYYIEKYGPWKARRGLILDQIHESGPDLITLQAVKKERNLFDGEDQATQIARNAGYPHTVFQPAVEAENGNAEGSAILSKYPPIEMDYLKLSLLPDIEDTNRRVLMNCLFNIPAMKLRIFNAHFSWVPEQATDNIQEALAYIRSFSEPFLLSGDLNTSPDSDLFDPFREAGMIDVWAELCLENSGFTFESDNPRMRIDYIWASSDLKNRLESIQVVGNRISPIGQRISDHLGLLVTVRDG